MNLNSFKRKRKKIIIVGAYPPPLGGVSVHAKRLFDLIKKSDMDAKFFHLNPLSKKSQDDNIIDFTKPSSKKIFWREIIDANIIHYHEVRPEYLADILILRLLHKKVLLTIHNERTTLNYNNMILLQKLKLQIYLNSFKKIISVSDREIHNLMNIGISSKKFCHIPAYIHPDIEYKPEILNNEINEFFNNDAFYICAAGRISLSVKPEIYGFDMMIEMMNTLSRKLNLRLFIVLLGKKSMDSSEKSYYKELKQRIEDNKLQERIMICEAEQFDFISILRKSSLYIRPNNTDGFSLSNSESLYVGTPVIASDVCRRTKGTVLFKSRDQQDFEKKVQKVVANYAYYKEKAKQTQVKDYGERILQEYRNV